jgi:hypothetical protein
MKRLPIPLIRFIPVALLIWAMNGCAVSGRNSDPLQKYAPEALREDYDLLQDVLEKFHPSLYWYTPREQMDSIFRHYRGAIRDSMTQQQFGFRVLAPVTTSIRCGHTSFSFSRQYTKYFRGLPLPSFPLYLKIWGDTMVVTENRDRSDSTFRRGTRITSINGLGAARLASTMFRFMPTDGYAENINYIRLSSAFPYYHRNIFGLQKNYQVGYLDSLGLPKTAVLPVYIPKQDTGRKRPPAFAVPRDKRMSRTERKLETRSLAVDKQLRSAYMNVESFDNGFSLKRFYRQSFRRLRKEQVEHLVIDVRNNGGGKVDNYTALARYLKDTAFRVADSAFALRRNFNRYGKYFQSNEVNWLAMKLFVTGKRSGLHRFRYWENHVFRPRSRNHFDGQVYLVISGPTFSASSLFCNTMKGQSNVTLVGEETGGGAYGNSGLMIPQITLPHTGMRVRVPLFRIVQYKHPPKDGRGVVPDIYVTPTVEGVTRGRDLKMEKVQELIRQSRSMAASPEDPARTPQ